MKVFSIISGGEKSSLDQLNKDSFIIACDKGYKYAIEENIIPSLVIGDFDSLDIKIDPSLNILKLPTEKDDTDTMSAIKYAIEHNAQEINIYCALGGRLDHLLGNIQAGMYASKLGIKVNIYSDDSILHFIIDSSIAIKKINGYSISVLSLTDESKGVSIEGAKYLLNNATINNSFPIGISNEWIDDIKVTVNDGILLVILSKM